MECKFQIIKTDSSDSNKMYSIEYEMTYENSPIGYVDVDLEFLNQHHFHNHDLYKILRKTYKAIIEKIENDKIAYFQNKEAAQKAIEFLDSLWILSKLKEEDWSFF